jgi:hypothetical protein
MKAPDFSRACQYFSGSGGEPFSSLRLHLEVLCTPDDSRR